MSKQNHFFFLFVFCIALFACNHADQLPVREMVLDFDEIKVSQRGDIQIRFKEVDNDSRCPSDAICSWPGLGVVVIELVADGLREEMTLSVNERTKYFESTIFENHEITLLELSPYPVSFYEAEDYQIKLSIE